MVDAVGSPPDVLVLNGPGPKVSSALELKIEEIENAEDTLLKFSKIEFVSSVQYKCHHWYSSAFRAHFISLLPTSSTGLTLHSFPPYHPFHFMSPSHSIDSLGSLTSGPTVQFIPPFLKVWIFL